MSPSGFSGGSPSGFSPCVPALSSEALLSESSDELSFVDSAAVSAELPAAADGLYRAQAAGIHGHDARLSRLLCRGHGIAALRRTGIGRAFAGLPRLHDRLGAAVGDSGAGDRSALRALLGVRRA